MDLRYEVSIAAFVLHDLVAPAKATVWTAETHREATEPLFPVGTFEWTWEEQMRG